MLIRAAVLHYLYSIFFGRSRRRLRIRDLFPPQGHPGGSAPIYIEYLAGYEVGSLRCKKSHGWGYVLRAPYSPPRQQAMPKLCTIVRDIEVAGHFDNTGADSVDPDILGSKLDGQLPGKSVDRP